MCERGHHKSTGVDEYAGKTKVPAETEFAPDIWGCTSLWFKL